MEEMRELKPKSTLSGQRGGLRDGAVEFCHRSVPMVTTTHLITKNETMRVLKLKTTFGVPNEQGTRWWCRNLLPGSLYGYIIIVKLKQER